MSDAQVDRLDVSMITQQASPYTAVDRASVQAISKADATASIDRNFVAFISSDNAHYIPPKFEGARLDRAHVSEVTGREATGSIDRLAVRAISSTEAYTPPFSQTGPRLDRLSVRAVFGPETVVVSLDRASARVVSDLNSDDLIASIDRASVRAITDILPASDTSRLNRTLVRFISSRLLPYRSRGGTASSARHACFRR